MARIILITGGGRSGKSRHAQALAEEQPGRKVFLATCPVVDDEMQDRIRLHRQDRQGRGWDTLEEPVELANALRGNGEYETVLVDCLTLWINNLIYHAELNSRPFTEANVAAAAADVLDACRKRAGTVLFVTNEVGMGIIPPNDLARRFRDLAGRCNQVVAAAADEVVLMVCGCPLTIKNGNSSAT